MVKSATVLRSSARRHLLTHLTKLYPLLEGCSLELVVQVYSKSIKYFVATTSAGRKFVVFADHENKPWWWEAGNDAGTWINAKGTNKTPELMPTIHMLLLIPKLLPVVATWP